MRDAGRRRRPHLHPEPPPPAARRGRPRRRQARGLREAARRDAAGAERLVAAAPEAGRQAAVPFVYRFYPTVREARERVRAGGTGAVHLVHGTYLQDWLLRPEDGNWRVDEALGGASRAFADIGSHWCDLAEFVTGQRLTRLSARTLTAVPERVSAAGRHAFAGGDGSGELRRVTHRGCRDRPVRDGCRRARVGRDQPGLRGPQEPAVDRGRRLGGGARLRPGAARAAVGRPSRGRDDRPPRSRVAVSGGGSLRDPARRPPPGLRGLLRRLRGGLLRGRPDGPGARRPAAVRRRPARQPHHRGRAGVGAERGMGRRRRRTRWWRR